mmetsp:Transcript_24318/g.34836  ORF Transcript_24318/g.34836 Transcript_24318/m.34836 type:complete len:158 (+) Transcript_24318:159-632(+)
MSSIQQFGLGSCLSPQHQLSVLHHEISLLYLKISLNITKILYFDFLRASTKSIASSRVTARNCIFLVLAIILPESASTSSNVFGSFAAASLIETVQLDKTNDSVGAKLSNQLFADGIFTPPLIPSKLGTTTGGIRFWNATSGADPGCNLQDDGKSNI